MTTLSRHIFGERRRYIRLELPVKIAYTVPNGRVIENAVTKNISADGLRFETHDKALNESSVAELKLDLPGTQNPVHAKGIVVWKKKISLEDRSPYDVGIEFSEIEEDNKNTFLKFFCDHIYNIKEQKR